MWPRQCSALFWRWRIRKHDFPFFYQMKIWKVWHGYVLHCIFSDAPKKSSTTSCLHNSHVLLDNYSSSFWYLFSESIQMFWFWLQTIGVFCPFLGMLKHHLTELNHPLKRIISFIFCSKVYKKQITYLKCNTFFKIRFYAVFSDRSLKASYTYYNYFLASGESPASSHLLQIAACSANQ